MGTEYTPTVLALITAWVDQRRNLLDLTGEPPEGIVERTGQAQRAIAKIRAEAWDQGAFAAATSLDHGGHNADNPHKE